MNNKNSSNLLKYNIDYSLIQDLNIVEKLKQFNIFPLYKEPLYLVVATSNISQDTAPIIELFNQPIKFIEANTSSVEFEIQYIKLKTKLYNLAVHSLDFNSKTDTNSYIIDFVDELFIFSVKYNASDIHIEAQDKSMIIRFRIDGVLNQYFRFDILLYPILSSIIKFLSSLDISQKRLPLSGRFSREVLDYTYDFRVSTLPTIHGESIVIRILDNQNIKKELSTIGFSTYDVDNIKQTLNSNAGMILVTGPTGSGKTTTLYSMLNYLNTKEKKIITIEDPVEYKLDGIIQVNINNDINLDYKTVLKNILRQDPDILMIGEIRDKESLEIALRASLTGHLVIATLHTNNALETITRLLDMEAQNYLIASTLKMVVSQRLIRVLCEHCKSFDNDTNSYISNSCKHCNLTGYTSRKIVPEILNIDQTISNMIAKDSTILDIEQYAKSKSFQTLNDIALKLVQDGTTSFGEYYSKI